MTGGESAAPTASGRSPDDPSHLPLGGCQAPAQRNTYLGLGAAMSSPSSSSSSSSCTGGRTTCRSALIRDTGLAVPFVVLFFMSIWGLP